MSFNKETGMYEGYIYRVTNSINGKIYIGQTNTTIKQRWTSHKTTSKTDGKPFYRAIRKYGSENFIIEEIISLSAKSKKDLINLLNQYETYYIEKEKSLITENGYNLTYGGETRSILNVKSVDQYDLQLNYIQSFNSASDASIKTNISEIAIRGNCKHQQQTAGGYIWCYSGYFPIKPKFQHEYDISDIDMSKYEPKQILKLMIMGWMGQKVIQYNIYGEIINIFNNPLESAEKLGYGFDNTSMFINSNRFFNNTKLLYEGYDFFDFTRNNRIRPVSMYDNNGNYIRRFENMIEAERFLGIKCGNIKQAINGNRCCRGYRFSFYGDKLTV